MSPAPCFYVLLGLGWGALARCVVLPATGMVAGCKKRWCVCPVGVWVGGWVGGCAICMHPQSVNMQGSALVECGALHWYALTIPRSHIQCSHMPHYL